VRGHDHPRGHEHQREDLQDDSGRGAVEPLVQPDVGEGDGDDRIADGDDREDRRDEGALLECVLVEQEAEWSHHRQCVDRPVGEQRRQATADIRNHELDQERGDTVANAAGKGERERPKRIAAPGHGEAARDGGDQADRQRQDDLESDTRPAFGRLRDDQETGHASRAGDHPADQDRIPPVAEVSVDEDGEDQTADQQRLDQCQRPVSECKHLEGKSEQGPADRRQPQRLPHQVEEDPRRQRLAGLDPLGTALVRHRRDAEYQRGCDGCHHGYDRAQLPVLTPGGHVDRV
jgi:hypothetical protein